MEQNSPKLFNKYFIIAVLLIIAFTFYKSVFLKNFTVINTEPVEEEATEDSSQPTDSLLEEVTDETNTSTSTATTSEELN